MPVVGPSCQIRLASASPAAPNSAIDASAPAKSAKVQTHSAKIVVFGFFSPRWSAPWAQRQPKTGSHHHQSGELRHPRLRHAGDTPSEGFAWRKTPIATNLKCASSAPRRLQDRRRAAWREKVRPTPPLQWHFREIVRPARVKTPNLGHFERAGRIFSRFHDLTATQGELFRACRRRPSSALPISDQALLVWRAPASTEGQATVQAAVGRQGQHGLAGPPPDKFRT